MVTEYLVLLEDRADSFVQYVSMTPQPVPYFIQRMILTVARLDAVDLGVMKPEVTNGLFFFGAFDTAGLLVV